MNSLINAVRQWARYEDTNVRAAADLLAAHGHWLRNQTFIDRCTYVADEYTIINWHGVSGMLDNREFPSSTSELAVLRIAVLLARDTFGMSSLDSRNRELVVAAVADALARR